MGEYAPNFSEGIDDMKDIIGIGAIIIVSGFIGYSLCAIRNMWTGPADALRLGALYTDAHRWRKVEALRNSADGAAVEIPCDNSDWNGLPDRYIIVTAYWDKPLLQSQEGDALPIFEARYYRADTIDECLDQALAALEPPRSPVPSVTMT